MEERASSWTLRFKLNPGLKFNPMFKNWNPTLYLLFWHIWWSRTRKIKNSNDTYNITFLSVYTVHWHTHTKWFRLRKLHKIKAVPNFHTTMFQGRRAKSYNSLNKNAIKYITIIFSWFTRSAQWFLFRIPVRIK